jgi:hypothetical protein
MVSCILTVGVWSYVLTEVGEVGDVERIIEWTSDDFFWFLIANERLGLEKGWMKE